MESSDALDVYRRWLLALNSRNWELLRDHLAVNATFTFTHMLPEARAVLHGGDAIVDSFRGWQSRFTSLPGSITDCIEAGSRVAVQLWWSGATVDGNEVAFASSHWATVVDGQIVELVDFFDEKGYLEQVRG